VNDLELIKKADSTSPSSRKICHKSFSREAVKKNVKHIPLCVSIEIEEYKVNKQLRLVKILDVLFGQLTIAIRLNFEEDSVF
jgi:hypothetical protein